MALRSKSCTGLRQSFRKTLSAYRREEDGAIVIFALFMFVMILMVGGIAVDMMRYESERVRLQGTADRAVLAATMMRSTSDGADPAQIIQDYFDAEGLGDYVQGRIQVIEQPGGREVIVAPRARMNTTFMRYSGHDSLEMRLVSGASEQMREVLIEIVMVLDVSGSMLFDLVGNQLVEQQVPNRRIDHLHDAAKLFVQNMLEDNDISSGEARVAITFVPYSTEVIMPPSTLTYFHNLADPPSGSMTNAFCIDFADWGPVVNSISADMWRRNCDLRSNTNALITDMPIRPFMHDVDEAVEYIESLWANWGTSIDLGVRAGAMFFDPTLRPVIDHLISEGEVSPVFTGRPFGWNEPATFRAMVLMTDGENCCYHANDPGTRKPSQEVQDADTVAVCESLKALNIDIYAVAFMAPQAGVELMEACASSPSHFFNSSGQELVDAFAEIATHIQSQSLRLTR